MPPGPQPTSGRAPRRRRPAYPAGGLGRVLETRPGVPMRSSGSPDRLFRPRSCDGAAMSHALPQVPLQLRCTAAEAVADFYWVGEGCEVPGSRSRGLPTCQVRRVCSPRGGVPARARESGGTPPLGDSARHDCGPGMWATEEATRGAAAGLLCGMFHLFVVLIHPGGGTDMARPTVSAG